MSVAQKPASRARLSAWMLKVTRPVLGALVASTVCRILDQFLVIALYVYAMFNAVDIAVRFPSHGRPSVGHIVMIALVMALMALGKGLLRYGEQFFGHYVAFKALELLRRETYEHLLPQAPAVMTTSDSGDLLARITHDIDRIEVFFAHTIAPAISAIIVPVGFVAVLAGTTTWPVALAAGVALALALLIIPTLGNGEGMASARNVAAEKGLVTQQVTDDICGIEEVIGYGAESQRLALLAEGEARAMRAGRAYRVLLASRRALSHLFMLGGAVGVFFAGMGSVDVFVPPTHTGPVISLAALAAASVGVIRCWEVVVGVEGFATYLANSFASAGRIYAIVCAAPAVVNTKVSEGGCPASRSLANKEPQLEEALPETSGTTEDTRPQAGVQTKPGQESAQGAVALCDKKEGITWENVTFTYPAVRGRTQSRPAVENVTIHVPQGAWACIVGATGSGKSTLISLLERYWDPDQGHIYVDGCDIRDMDVTCLRQKIAVVTQRTHVFADTVANNLRLARQDATDDELMEALRLACLDGLINQMDKGLQTPVGSGGTGLSGGQVQRLSLARAYLQGCDIFVLDEFTAHLDPGLAIEVRRRLRQYAPHATVIEVTHGLDTIEGADLVAVIDGGKVIEHGQPGDLLNKPDSLLAGLAARRA